MHSYRRVLPLFLIYILFLAGCGATATPTETPSLPTVPATVPAPPQPTETATPEPPSTLVVCTQDEPDTLYIYGGTSRSMWSVLEAVYDGPFDTRGFAVQPVILERAPVLGEDAQVRAVTVQAGDPVVDADGNLVALAAGTHVLPSGCTRPDCAQAWDGASALQMDQLVVTFRLLAGLQWSDGEPLTAGDSVFSYALAANPATPSSKYLTDRTFSYHTLDEQTIEWIGMPGFFEQRFATFFWLPLPEHALGSLSAEALLADERATRAPLGWGPYTITEWIPGDHITLRKNERYFRAGEGLPAFETLVYRFIGRAADGNMNSILAGECDVVDQNEQFLQMVPDLLERENQNKLKTYVGQGPEWEHLDFGIRPAAYDDGYNPASGDRPDLLGDSRVRQAIAFCIDRQSIVDTLLYRRSVVPRSYLPPAHPLYREDLPEYPFSPEQGARLLEEAGWKDPDNDPGTPRVSVGVPGVPDGTALSLEYLTTEAALRRQVAQVVAGNLLACGIQVQQRFLNPGELFAPGPNGPVFGRKFDLVQFSWEASSRPNCLIYASSQVPSEANRWVGANITGMSSPAYDAACAAAYWARPNEGDFVERSRLAQEQYLQDLPALPLYFYPKITISRSDLCGLEFDVTARSIFWNLENIGYGENCP